MLVEFTIENYLSFKEQTTFSLVASSIHEKKEANTFQAHTDITLLKSSVIYGANASGKSNLFAAIGFMKKFVLNSSKETQLKEDIDVESFKLSTITIDEPSLFEIVFIKNEHRYRYGFIADKKEIFEEWLYSSKKSSEKELFYRTDKTINLSSTFKEGKGLEKKTRQNALFLSVVANFNGEISKQILEWFNDLQIVSGSSNAILRSTKNKLKEENFKKKIVEFLKVADLSIDDISLESVDIEFTDAFKEIPEEIRNRLLRKVDIIMTHHKVYDEDNKISSSAYFHAEKSESQGTLKLLSLSVPILEALENGYTLLVDELDAKFHPLITKFIIESFNSENNSKNAQLIFNTHDTTHLSNKYYRRDQIWFSEKDRYGSTDLYSLVEYKVNNNKIRNDASYSKDYIHGKYGAIPYIGDFESLLLGDNLENGESQSVSQKEEKRT